MIYLDIDKTVHYTTQSEKVCGNLIRYIPDNINLIEPFVGQGDLLKLFPNYNWETYDIQAENPRDTLLNPPDYYNKWVITNPPFLAKNKAKDKQIYDKYQVDDLYKAALLSILDCSGGIIITPANFFLDERTGEIRSKFLNQFQILALNIFSEPVFESTTYSICSFAFKRKENKAEPQNIIVNQNINITLSPEYDYRIAGEYYADLNSYKNIFGRLTETSKDFPTNMKLYALDTREQRIRLEYDENHFIGKNTDRSYATLTCKYQMTKEQEKELIKAFNNEIENFRNKYSDLPLTNYRDYGRKRIGFTLAYKILTKLYYEVVYKWEEK